VLEFVPKKTILIYVVLHGHLVVNGLVTGKPHDLNGIIDGFQIFPEKPIHTVQLVQDFNQKWGYPWNFMGKKLGFKGNFSLDI